VNRLRQRITYGNLMATAAIFIALGGGAYAAIQLPRNSVGPEQIRPRAVGSSELRTGAVSSRSIRDRSVQLRDIARPTRAALRGAVGPKGDPGPQGPSGVTYRATVNSGGATVRGNAIGVTHQGGSGLYTIAFERDVSSCVTTATLAEAQNGPMLEQPPAGRITVGTDSTRAAVRTFDVDGSVRDLPFNVVVIC
jgi:hypothetical protein